MPTVAAISGTAIPCTLTTFTERGLDPLETDNGKSKETRRSERREQGDPTVWPGSSHSAVESLYGEIGLVSRQRI